MDLQLETNSQKIVIEGTQEAANCRITFVGVIDETLLTATDKSFLILATIFDFQSKGRDYGYFTLPLSIRNGRGTGINWRLLLVAGQKACCIDIPKPSREDESLIPVYRRKGFRGHPQY